MKKLLLKFIILFTVLSANSQTPYYKMLGDTNRWYVSGYIIGVKSAGMQNTADIGGPCIGYYRANKDTLYNGLKYKKFELENTFLVCPYFNGPPLNFALIREDTILRRVYIVHPDSINESVAMDFSLNIGDSLYLPFPPTSNVLMNGYYKLDSIRSKPEIFGNRNHFYLSKFDAPINFVTNQKYYIEYIESIGATHFPINVIGEEQSYDFNMPFSCKTNQYSSYVTCKYTDHIKNYQDSCALRFVNTHSGYVLFGDNCEFYGFTGQVKNLSFINQLELFPNPMMLDNLTLKFKASVFEPIEVAIYNALGQKIFSQSLLISTEINEITFNGLKLSQGLYTLQMKSKLESSRISFIKN